MEKEGQLESTKDDTRNNFEPIADTSELDDKNLQKDASITNGLEKTNDLESIANEMVLETMQEKTHSRSEIKEKAYEKEISIEDETNQNKNSSTNHSMTEPSGDENQSQKEPANNRDGTIQEESFVKNTANTTGTSNNSLALEESCVIDLDDDEEEEVIDLSDADDQQQSFQMRLSTSKLSETLNKSISAMSITEMLPFCTPLTSMPALGDIVVFKFNRINLSETKKEVSEFIACKCEHVNRRTKVLKLAVLDASLEKDIIPQHYVYNLDESSNNRFMNIKFPEMIDPKVLKT